MFGAAMMWGFLASLIALPVYFAWYAWDNARRRRRGEHIDRPSGGTFGFDEVWRPSAAAPTSRLTDVEWRASGIHSSEYT